jgi:polyisoprenoid-binding protein YceI
MTEEQFQKATKIREKISRVSENLRRASREDCTVNPAFNGNYQLREVSSSVNDMIKLIGIADLEGQLKRLQAELDSI